MLLVEHTRCAEHGELVHDARGHDSLNHQRAAVPHAAADVAGFEGAGGDASDPAHEHCAPLADRHDATVAIASVEVPSPLLLPTLDGPFTATAVLPRESRFRVAPKNSPPA